MSLAELQRVAVPDFGGQITRLDATNVPIDKALASSNCEFNPLQVSTRKGFGAVTNFGTTSPIHSMTNWIVGTGNKLVYLRRHGIDTATPQFNIVNIVSGSGGSGGGLPTSTIGISVAGAALIVYLAAYTIDTSTGAVTGNFSGYASNGSFFDVLFLGPLTDIPTLGSSGSGHLVTAGTHRVGYLVQTNAGYSGRFSPVGSNGFFNPASAVTVTAGQQIDFSITLTWPNEASLVYAVMTTIDNLDRYFLVPNLAPVAVTGGASSTVSFSIDISDADLASTGTNITDNQYLFTTAPHAAPTLGASPFSPSVIVNFGSRVVYLTEIGGIYQAYVSEPDNGQAITADEHVLYLPGQRLMRTAGALGQSLYILGPHWTYSFQDTGDVPALWPPPRLVDGSIGTLSPHGFTIDATTGLGWCADTGGLYAFLGGSYQAMPVSYFNEDDWKRINWLNGQYMKVSPTVVSYPAEPVKVVDDKENKRVYVAAPLNVNARVNTNGTAVQWIGGDQFSTATPIDATECAAVIYINGTPYIIASVIDELQITLTTSAGTQTNVAATISPIAPTDLLVFDYSDGISFDKIKYSKWSIVSFSPSGMCMVQNPTTGQRELWLGRWAQTSAHAGGAEVVRLKNTRDDALPYNDDGLAIHAVWKSALLPGMDLDVGRIYYHYAMQFRATGSGAFFKTIYGLDGTVGSNISPSSLSAAPGVIYTDRYTRLRSEGASYLCESNIINTFFVLSGLDHFFGIGPSYR